MKAVKIKLPFDDHQFDSNFTRLIDRIAKLKEEGLGNYTSAGTLEFVNGTILLELYPSLPAYPGFVNFTCLK
jgi:hypothetical protein